MNLRRGLFRLWIVGAALFVLAYASYRYSEYSEIKAEFDDAASKPLASTLATDARLADWVYKKFYSDMPREQFDKKIATENPIIEPKVVAQLKAIITNIDPSRPLDEWSIDELLAYKMYPNIHELGAWPTLYWPGVLREAAIALGIPLAVLALGSSLLWALSGFAVTRQP